MKRILIYVLLFFCFQSLYGQTSHLVINGKVPLGTKKSPALAKADKQYRAGKEFSRNAEFQKALIEYQKAEISYKKLNDDQRLSIANVYHGIAYVYNHTDKLEKAYDYQLESIKLATAKLGENNPDLGRFYGGMGQIEDRRGNYQSSYEYFRKQLDLRSILKDSSQLGHPLEEFAVINWRLENYDSALVYFNQALLIFKRKYGEIDESVTSCYYNMGLVYSQLEDYDKALEYHTKDLEISLKLFGNSHPNVGMAYNCIGKLHFKKQDYQLSLSCLEKSLVVFRKKLPEDHTDLSYVYYDLSQTCNKLNDKENAIKFAQKAYDSRNKYLGSAHPLTNEALENLNEIKSF